MRYQRNSVARRRNSRSSGSSISILADFGEKMFAEFRRPIGQEIFAFPRRHREQLAEKIHRGMRRWQRRQRRQKFVGAKKISWRSGGAAFSARSGRASHCAAKQRRAKNASGADDSLQEREQFLVGVRRLSHALDGVEIFQRVHVGQRL